MSKLMIFFGILLMIAAFALLFFFVLLPPDMQSHPQVVAINNRLFCQPGEHFVQNLGLFVTDAMGNPAGRELTNYCVDAEGQQRDVTMQSIGIMIAGFTIPFVLGLLLSIIGTIAWAAGRTRRRLANAGGAISNAPVTVYTSTPGQGKVHYSTTVMHMDDQDVPAEAQAVIRQIMEGFQASAAQTEQTAGSDSPDLVGRLRQLEEARSANLISQSEYDRVRQQILDSMDD